MKLDQIWDVVTDIKKQMHELRGHNKEKKPTVAERPETSTADIDTSESDSFVVSLNKARSVSDLKTLGLEYNNEGKFFFVLRVLIPRVIQSCRQEFLSMKKYLA
jgi:hypothetical protein